MGDTVNRTSEIAAEWQRHIVWIRMNAAYIRAELAYLSGEGHDVSDIQVLLDSFDSTFEQFTLIESGVFVAARLSETGQAEKEALAGGLRRMRESFSAWLHDYDQLIQVKEAADPQAPLVLLQCCGGELLTAHSRFVNVIDAYVDEIEQAT